MLAAKKKFKRLSVAQARSERSQTPSEHTPTGKRLIASQLKIKVPTAKATTVTTIQKQQPTKKVTVEEESSSEEEEDVINPCDNDSDDMLETSGEDCEGGVELLPQEGKKWGSFYRDLQARDATTRGHFISTFFKYLLHVEGGCHSEEQALIHTRQVNIIFDTVDPLGRDLNCLVRNDRLDFWDKFCHPKLTKKELTGNTLKVYIRSLELFILFIKKISSTRKIC